MQFLQERSTEVKPDLCVSCMWVNEMEIILKDWFNLRGFYEVQLTSSNRSITFVILYHYNQRDCFVLVLTS